MRTLAVSAALFLLAIPTTAAAQDATTGALDGRVTDPAGAALAGAVVRIESRETHAVRSVATDLQGEFFFPSLAPGTYSATMTAAGFASVQQASLEILLGRTARVLAPMPVASAATSVTVQGGSVSRLVSLDSPLNGDVTPSELALAPIDGRRFQSYASLTPLVSNTPSTNIGAEDRETYTRSGYGNQPDDFSASWAGQVQVRGTDPVDNSFALDGASLTRAFDSAPRGGNALPFAVPLEGVQEFQVRAVAGRGGSSLGRDAGGSIQTVTRAGSEAFHGTAFLLVRNSAFAATDPYSLSVRYNSGSPTAMQVKPRDQREQFGASAGGALLPRRVFGFVSAEAQRRSFPAVSSPLEPGFYNLSAGQLDLLGNRGVSRQQASTALGFLDSLSGELPRQANEFALAPRLDFRGAGSVSSSLVWVHTAFDSPQGSSSAAVVNVGRGSLSSVSTHADTVLLRSAAVLSPRWTGEARAAWSRDASAESAGHPLPQEPQTAPGGAAPSVRIEQGFAFGSPSALGSRRLPQEMRLQLGAGLQFAGASQTVALSADASRIQERISSLDGSNGSYDYTSGITGGHAGGLVDFITDYTYNANAYPNGACPSIYAADHNFCFRSYTQSFGVQPETRFAMGELSASAGDHWRPTSRVRVDLNARYEYTGMPRPQSPNAALDAAFGPELSTSHYPSDTNNLAPSVGIAVAATRSTVLLVGYGYRFGRIAGRTLQTALENTDAPESRYRVRLVPKTEVQAACSSYGTNFGYPATFRCPVPEALIDTTRAVMFSRGFQLPAAQTFEFSLEHQFPRNWEVSLSYAVALSRQLTNTRDANIAPATRYAGFQVQRADSGGTVGARNGDTFYLPMYTARRNPAFGPVTALESNGNGTYNGAILQVERRAFRGLTVHGFYTFSKALDTVRASGLGVNENSQFDPFQPLYDKAASAFDHRQRVVLLASGETGPHGTSVLSRMLTRNWSVAPLWMQQSGGPYSYEISGGSALAGARYSLNGSGGANYLPSVGRNTLRLPWTEHLDLRVARGVLLREHAYLRFSAEAFNLFNRVNVTGLQQRAFLPGKAAAGLTPLVFQDAATIAAEGLPNLAFGTPVSASYSGSRERRLQFGIRTEW